MATGAQAALSEGALSFTQLSWSLGGKLAVARACFFNYTIIGLVIFFSNHFPNRRKNTQRLLPLSTNIAHKKHNFEG